MLHRLQSQSSSPVRVSQINGPGTILGFIINDRNEKILFKFFCSTTTTKLCSLWPTILLGVCDHLSSELDLASPIVAFAIMMQNHRRLSKPSRGSRLSSLRRYPLLLKGCLLCSFTLLLCLHYQYSYSIAHIDDNTVSNSDTVFQSLRTYPDDLPTLQSSVEKWERQAENPLIGLFRYSSISAIHLPTADLEVPQLTPKQIQEGNDSLVNNEIVVLTMKGHKFNPEDEKRTPNQDRVVVLSKQDGSSHDTYNASNEWWMGLFDGHGYFGHDVSQYVSSEFARRINKEWEDKDSALSSKANDNMSSENVKDTIKTMFVEINQAMPSFMNTSGSTGISVLKKGNSLYFSNIGDSVGFVASYDKRNGSLEILYATKPHKPDNPSERKRIEEAGGRVQLPPTPRYSARLIIPVLIDGQTIEIGLAMSRSFGDHDGLNFGLSSEPDTDVLDLSQFDKTKDYFVVAATDGLIDNFLLSEKEVARAMAKAMSDEKDQQGQIRRRSVSDRATEAAKKLMLKSAAKWFAEGDYRDDISIIVHRIRL